MNRYENDPWKKSMELKLDYNNMMETLYLMSIPGMEEEIVEGMNTPLEDCVPADEVGW